MIDLDYSRERMLADIRASAAVLANGSIDPPSFADLVSQEQSRVVVRRHTEEEILPALSAALSTRFADVPPKHLDKDLLALLKRSLGNAYKRGNQGDGDKWITVEVIVTPEGAFIEVSDEGAGFDVAAICEKLRAGLQYFTNKGGGFRRFHKTKSVVSFTNRGRTFRACFLREPPTRHRLLAGP